MLWLLNPPEPCAWATHPFGLRRDGYGCGLVNAVPYHLQLHCNPSGPLPAWPEACGSFVLSRTGYATFDQDTRAGGTASPTWVSQPVDGWVWSHSLRSLSVSVDNSTSLLGLAWWTWFGPFSGVGDFLPPVYTTFNPDGWQHSAQFDSSPTVWYVLDSNGQLAVPLQTWEKWFYVVIDDRVFRFQNHISPGAFVACLQSVDPAATVISTQTSPIEDYPGAGTTHDLTQIEFRVSGLHRIRVWESDSPSREQHYLTLNQTRGYIGSPDGGADDPDAGSYTPLRGERFARIATPAGYSDDMPSSVLVLPWFP